VAQRWLDEATTALVSGQYVDPRAGRETFSVFYAVWLQRQVWAPNTRKAVPRAAVRDRSGQSSKPPSRSSRRSSRWRRSPACGWARPPVSRSQISTSCAAHSLSRGRCSATTVVASRSGRRSTVASARCTCPMTWCSYSPGTSSATGPATIRDAGCSRACQVTRRTRTRSATGGQGAERRRDHRHQDA
jgi:hypothetical protein